MKLDDFLDAFNWIDRLQGLFSSFVHADWKGATQREGPLGLVGELGRTAIGANTWTFHVPIESDWSGGEIERFLNHYGIIVWGRRVTGSHSIVTVKRRQAVWAEYLLLRRGISLSEPFCNPANVRYAQQHAPGDQPPAWADRDGKGKPGIEKLLDWLP